MLRIFTRSRRMPPEPVSIITSSRFGQAGQHPVAVGFVASFYKSREGGFRIRLPCFCLRVTLFPSDADSNAKSCPSPKNRSGSSGPFLLCRQSEKQNGLSAGMCRPQTLAGLMLLCALYCRRACAPERRRICAERSLFFISASILRSIQLFAHATRSDGRTGTAMRR